MSKKNIIPQQGKQLYLNQLFLKGMLHTSSEMHEGYTKTLTNFDIAPTGDSAIPRKPFNSYTTNVEGFNGKYIYPVKFTQAINQQHYIKFENTITEDDYVKYNEGSLYSSRLDNFGIKMFSRDKDSIKDNTTFINIHGAGSSTVMYDINRTSLTFSNNKLALIDNDSENAFLDGIDITDCLINVNELQNNNTMYITKHYSPDGDSGIFNDTYSYRLILVNCPEINNEWHDYGQAFANSLYKWANYNNKELLYIEYGKDIHDRNLIELYIRYDNFNYVSVNLLLLKLGLASIDYAYDYIFEKDYNRASNLLNKLIDLKRYCDINMYNKNDFDPFYNYAYNIITNNSITINEITYNYKIIAVKLSANSYPSSKVMNTIDKVMYIYDDGLDAIGFIGMLVRDDNRKIIYKGPMYIRANATRTKDSNGLYNYNNPNFYVYLPEEDLQGKFIDVVNGSSTGYNLLDSNPIHIEDTEKRNKPFSVIGLAVTDPNSTTTTIVDQAIPSQKVKLNVITNLGYYYNSSTTTTDKYGYTLNYNVDYNGFEHIADNKTINKLSGSTESYEYDYLEIYNRKLENAVNIEDTVVWEHISNNINVDDVIRFSSGTKYDLIYDDYKYYYKHIDNDTSTTYAVIINVKELDTAPIDNRYGYTVFFTKDSIPYYYDASDLKVYRNCEPGSIDIKFNSLYLEKDNEIVVSKNYTDKQIIFNNEQVYTLDLIDDPSALIQMNVLLNNKSVSIKSNTINNKFITNINGKQVDVFAGSSIYTFKIHVYHNINNINKVLVYDQNNGIYTYTKRNSVNKPTYLFSKWEYSSSDGSFITIQENNTYTYYTTSDSNIISKNLDDDITWTVPVSGNVSLKYTIQPKIRMSENESSWLYDVFIANELQETFSTIPVFKIGNSIETISKEDILENIDIKNATRIGIFNRQTILYGPYTKSNFLQFSMFEKEWYYPFPYYNISFDEPIVYVYNYRDSLIVFTKYNVYMLSGSTSILECTKTTLYENLSISLPDINLVNTVGKYLLFFNNNMGYIMVPNLYVQNSVENSNIYKLSENIINLEDDPEQYIIMRKHTGINNTRKIINNNPISFVQNNEIYLVYNYKYNSKTHTVIYIYNTDYKYWRLYDSAILENINDCYICEPYLNNQFISTNDDHAKLIILNNLKTNSCLDIDYTENSTYNINCFIDSGYLSVDTMNDKRFKDLIIELDNISDTLNIKCNFYIDGSPMLIEDAELIDKFNNVSPVSAEKLLVINNSISAISLENFDTIDSENYYGTIYKLDTDCNSYLLGNRNHFRIPLFGKGRLPSFTLELTSNKTFEFINYSIIYKEKNINRRR